MVQGVRVSVWGAADARSELPAALRRAVNAFRTLNDWYGSYDLPTLKVIVGDLPFGGSEYPGLVFSTPDNATVAHEVAHQWFYGIVGNDQYSDPFLDESLTAYAEQEFHHSYRCNLASPLDGRAHGLSTGMEYWENHADGYQHTIYRGGACALTVLRRDIGETAFRAALRAYVTANAGKIAAVQDFLDAIHNAAPSYDVARWAKLVGLAA
jgi:aminopeptidase N